MTKKIKLIILSLFLLTSAQPVAANDLKTCEGLLFACHMAYTGLKEKKTADTKLIQKQQELLKKQAEKIVDLENEAWYHSKWIYLGLGTVVGGYLVKEIRE